MLSYQTFLEVRMQHADLHATKRMMKKENAVRNVSIRITEPEMREQNVNFEARFVTNVTSQKKEAN
jgi:hypothetical protein